MATGPATRRPNNRARRQQCSAASREGQATSKAAPGRRGQGENGAQPRGKPAANTTSGLDNGKPAHAAREASGKEKAAATWPRDRPARRRNRRRSDDNRQQTRRGRHRVRDGEEATPTKGANHQESAAGTGEHKNHAGRKDAAATGQGASAAENRNEGGRREHGLNLQNKAGKSRPPKRPARTARRGERRPTKPATAGQPRARAAEPGADAKQPPGPKRPRPAKTPPCGAPRRPGTRTRKTPARQTGPRAQNTGTPRQKRCPKTTGTTRASASGRRRTTRRTQRRNATRARTTAAGQETGRREEQKKTRQPPDPRERRGARRTGLPERTKRIAKKREKNKQKQRQRKKVANPPSPNPDNPPRRKTRPDAPVTGLRTLYFCREANHSGR